MLLKSTSTTVDLFYIITLDTEPNVLFEIIYFERIVIYRKWKLCESFAGITDIPRHPQKLMEYKSVFSRSDLTGSDGKKESSRRNYKYFFLPFYKDMLALTKLFKFHKQLSNFLNVDTH